ncbi:ATP-binding protein, partial [Planctomycetota bacterium]
SPRYARCYPDGVESEPRRRSGITKGIVCVIREIRELRLLKEREGRASAAAAAARSARDTIRAMSEGVMLVANDGTISSINPAFERLTGCAREDLIDHSAIDILERLLPQDAADELLSVLDSRREEDEPFELVSTRIRSRDGRSVHVTLTVTSVDDQDGRPLATIVTVDDITKLRRFDAELQRIAKLESLGLLAGGIAHDFNNLLTTLLGGLSLLQEVGSMASARDILDDVTAATERARMLTDQLLTFSKGGAPVKERTTLQDLLEQSVRFALRGSNVGHDLRCEDDVSPVDVDRGQIGQVISNVIINAAQAMPSGGVVTVRAENVSLPGTSDLPLDGGAYVRVVMRDSGVGISEDHLAKVFDPYFTTKERGTGLGLATSHSIVQRHGGHTTVDSQVGVGTTVTIYLPASPQRGAGASVRTEGATPRFDGRVLVMDDEEPVRRTAQRLLLHLGADVECAQDGEEAIERYRMAKESGDPFAVVILDLTVPAGMGGQETLEHLSEIDPDVRAVASSGYSNDAIMADYRSYGFSGLLAKPYGLAEASEALASATSGSHVRRAVEGAD